jgi:hypothetical protein
MRHKTGPDLIVGRESLEKSTPFLLQETSREAYLECVTSIAHLQHYRSPPEHVYLIKS